MSTQQRPSPLGGGVFIALFSIIGVVAGGMLNQPTLGLLTGLAAGAALSVLLWLRERNNER